MPSSDHPFVAAPVAAPAATRSAQRRLLRWVALLTALFAVGAGTLRYLRAREPPPVRFQTVLVDRGPIASKVTASGTVVLLGVGVTYALAGRLGWAFSVRLDMVTLAVGFSALVGIAFGLYPARKAARLEPIEALRYE